MAQSIAKYFLALFIIFTASNAYASTEYAQNFEAYLKEERLNTINGSPLYKNGLTAFYQARGFKPVWFDQNGRTINDIEKLTNVISKQAYLNGLEPNDYVFEHILTSNDNDLFKREWMLTNAVMHYINDIRTGRIKPSNFDSMIFMPPQHRALDERTARLIESRNPEKYLESLVPPHPEYKQLRKKLADYRAIAKQGGWPNVDIKSSALIYPGESHESIPDVRERLQAAYHDYDGQLPDGIWVDESQLATEKLVDHIAHKDKVVDQDDKEMAQIDPAFIYDNALAKKVAEFQYFHGKKSDGVIGPETLSILKRPVEEHIKKIKMSMERWRWLPDDLGSKHVRINIAAFYARVVENGQDQFVMPIIVGKVAHQTPVFSSVIKNVKMHPDWTAPSSISNRYVIPKIRKNPNVIHSLGYQAISRSTGQIVPWDSVDLASMNTNDYIFRQRPGNKNALGLARFSIENNYAIFMHGTPFMNLFEEDDRNYSSGCVRLEDPLKMAKFLLEDTGMSNAQIENLYHLDDGEFPDTTFIDLKEDVPVHLMYMTAWIDQKEHLHFARIHINAM